MNVYLTALLFILTIGVVTFPLFFSRIQRHELQRDQATPDTSESDTLLSALSELEDDFQLGRLNKDEYQQQKIRLQRQYLKLKETPENGWRASFWKTCAGPPLCLIQNRSGENKIKMPRNTSFISGAYSAPQNPLQFRPNQQIQRFVPSQWWACLSDFCW